MASKVTPIGPTFRDLSIWIEVHGHVITGILEILAGTPIAQQPLLNMAARLRAARYAIATEFEQANVNRSHILGVDFPEENVVRITLPPALGSAPEPILAQFRTIVEGRLGMRLLY